MPPRHLLRVLVEDYIRKNCIAAVNVLMASPVFYFAFAKIYGMTIPVSLVRSITGSVRVAPFISFFYGFFAVVCPFVTQFFMERGQTYEEAQTTAAIAVMLSGFVFIEALVELRGCGVTFAQMTRSSFLIFIPALVGRLATGVLTQQQKVGGECTHVYACVDRRAIHMHVYPSRQTRTRRNDVAEVHLCSNSDPKPHPDLT